MSARDKWDFAIGTTSRVPTINGDAHYLILDYDGWTFPEIFQKITSLPKAIQPVRFVGQPTQNGWHIYTDFPGVFSWAVSMAKVYEADEAWIRIAEKRGYFFLADKDAVPLPWPVERMAIWRDRK